jgi:lipid-A-disaccharide synthase-like uncharacterized protein
MKKYILWFLVGFISGFLFSTITAHFFSSKGMPPQSWKEIFDNIWIYIFVSVLGGIVLAIRMSEEDK